MNISSKFCYSLMVHESTNTIESEKKHFHPLRISDCYEMFIFLEKVNVSMQYNITQFEIICIGASTTVQLMNAKIIITRTILKMYS